MRPAEPKEAGRRIQECLPTLKERGAVCTTLSELSGGNYAGLEGAIEIAEDALASSSLCGMHVPASLELVHCFAISDDLLTLAESYLATPPALVAIHIREDRGSDLAHHLSDWHVDAEDRAMLRLITYLSDVGSESLPFEYFPSDAVLPLVADIENIRGDADSNPAFQRVHVADMDVGPDQKPVRCTGPRGTVVIADTARVPHRVAPGSGWRRSMTLTYTSRAPHFPAIRWSDRFEGRLSPRRSSAYFIGDRR